MTLLLRRIGLLRRVRRLRRITRTLRLLVLRCRTRAGRLLRHRTRGCRNGRTRCRHRRLRRPVCHRGSRLRRSGWRRCRPRGNGSRLRCRCGSRRCGLRFALFCRCRFDFLLGEGELAEAAGRALLHGFFSRFAVFAQPLGECIVLSGPLARRCGRSLLRRSRLGRWPRGQSGCTRARRHRRRLLHDLGGHARRRRRGCRLLRPGCSRRRRGFARFLARLFYTQPVAPAARTGLTGIVLIH